MNSIQLKLIELATLRGDDKTFCPSEVARELYPLDWTAHMNNIRKEADKLVRLKKLVVMQKGVIINDTALDAIGPIRLRKK